MYFGKKNITKNLAVSEEVANIAMRDSDNCVSQVHNSSAITAHPCVPICYANGRCLANKRGCALLFIHYLTKLLNYKCETVKKLVGRGIIVPVLHSYLNETSVSHFSSAICGIFRSIRKKLSTKYHSARMCAKSMVQALPRWTSLDLTVPSIRSLRWDLPLPTSKANTVWPHPSMFEASESSNFKILGYPCSVPA